MVENLQNRTQIAPHCNSVVYRAAIVSLCDIKAHECAIIRHGSSPLCMRLCDPSQPSFKCAHRGGEPPIGASSLHKRSYRPGTLQITLTHLETVREKLSVMPSTNGSVLPPLLVTHFIYLSARSVATAHKLDFVHFSGPDPEDAFVGDEHEGVVQRHGDSAKIVGVFPFASM